MSEAARADRRQRAREAGFDQADADAGEISERAIEMAIETATRVQITPEVIEAFRAYANGCHCRVCLPTAITAAFEAAGFEVEE